MLFGRSLGGAVAFALASLVPPQSIRALVVENTFTSIDGMVLEIARNVLKLQNQRLRWLFSWVLYFYLTSHWASSAVVHKVTSPVLFMSGQSDELVPPAQMQKLFDGAKQAEFREIVLFAGGTHNETHMQDPPRYYEAMCRFLHKVFSKDVEMKEWLDKIDSVSKGIRAGRPDLWALAGDNAMTDSRCA